jgi:hypothetical protein
MKTLSALVGAVALLAGLAVGSPALAASNEHVTTCSGDLAAGDYQRVVVPAGAVCIVDGPVTIQAGVFIEPGATFVLGGEEGGRAGIISGGVWAFRPASVQIHFTGIDGGIHIHGGSGPFGGPFDITWNAIEDNRINGDVTIEGYNGFWFGFIRNNVHGTVTLNHNVLADPDGNEYVTNVIHGDLNCAGNSPAPQVGDSEGGPNIVTGVKTGQCASL